MTAPARPAVGRLWQPPLWLRLIAAVVLLLGVALLGTVAVASTVLRGHLVQLVDA